MLKREYGHLPVARQYAIHSAYGTFFDFLVDNPFPRNSDQGTFHQHYRIGGVLVAVGVVDILPDGLSSVYLFYSPTFARDLVPLGKITTMMEIEYTASRSLTYYYLGYYIESCRKMRYKAEYGPSQLLCPVQFQWVDAAVAQKQLVAASPQHHYAQLYMEGSPGDESATERTADSVRRAMKEVRMDVGMGPNFATLDMLQQGGQESVTPFLYDFVQYMTPEIGLEFVVDFS